MYLSATFCTPDVDFAWVLMSIYDVEHWSTKPKKSMP